MREQTNSTELTEALRGSEGRYREIVRHAGIGIGHVGLTGRWIDANPMMCEITGYTRDVLLNKTFQEITVPEDLAEDLELFRRLVADEIPVYSLCKRYVHANGHHVWIELTATMVRPEGEDPYAIAIIRDATDLRHARVALERLVQVRTNELDEVRSERDTFFHLSPDIFVIVELENGIPFIRRANPALCTLLQYSEDELKASPLTKFVHPDDLARTLDVSTVRKHLGDGTFENRYVTRSGEVRWLSWVSAPLDGRYYCAARDVTATKERLRTEQDHRERLAAASKLNALGRMAANISHEVKNPLTVVYANACQLEKALDPDAPEPHRRMIQEIQSMSLRIVKIVDGLRGFSREASRDPFEVVPLRRILDETLSFCRARFTLDHVNFECQAVTDDVTLRCQQVQIQQVLLNLLNNAYDAAKSTNEVVKRMGIRYRTEGDKIYLIVYDNGAGVDPAVRSHIFEPFFTTKQVGQGTGLGLNIAREIVRSHAGRIFLDETAGDTTFVVELPRTLA